MSQSNDSLRIQHMLYLAREATEILGDRKLDAIISDRVLQLALLHLVGVIGEAAAKVTEEGRKTLFLRNFAGYAAYHRTASA